MNYLNDIKNDPRRVMNIEIKSRSTRGFAGHWRAAGGSAELIHFTGSGKKTQFHTLPRV